MSEAKTTVFDMREAIGYADRAREANNRILLEQLEFRNFNDQTLLEKIKDEKLRRGVQLALEANLLEGRMQAWRSVLFHSPLPSTEHERLLSVESLGKVDNG
jgi:hypothetical protein